jgi:hypothetical protein
VWAEALQGLTAKAVPFGKVWSFRTSADHHTRIVKALVEIGVPQKRAAEVVDLAKQRFSAGRDTTGLYMPGKFVIDAAKSLGVAIDKP